MVITAVSLTLLVGVAALAVDAGRQYRERRNTQAAADAAAEAASIELYDSYDSYHGLDGNNAARASAIELARANGYEASKVTVNIPPASGAHAGQAGYTEVIVSAPIPRTFSYIFGRGDLVVTSRAVSGGTMIAGHASVLMLEPKRKDGLKLKGKSSVLEVAGDVAVNSTDKRAVKVDKHGQIIADDLLVTGGVDRNSKKQINASVSTGVEPTPDPLASLPVPAKGTDRDPNSFKTTINGRDVYNLLPGKYKELKFDDDDIVNMAPGEYYVEGEIAFKEQCTVTGNRVMIYSAGKKGVKIKTTGTVTLSPPISGSYAGVTLFQNRTSKSKIEFKNNVDLNFTGIIYAANSEVKFKKTDLDDDDEDWESESDDYTSVEDGSASDYMTMGASIISRKLSLDQNSHVHLLGTDINVQKPLRGLVE